MPKKSTSDSGTRPKLLPKRKSLQVGETQSSLKSLKMGGSQTNSISSGLTDAHKKASAKFFKDHGKHHTLAQK